MRPMNVGPRGAEESDAGTHFTVSAGEWPVACSDLILEHSHLSNCRSACGVCILMPLQSEIARIAEDKWEHKLNEGHCSFGSLASLSDFGFLCGDRCCIFNRNLLNVAEQNSENTLERERSCGSDQFGVRSIEKLSDYEMWGQGPAASDWWKRTHLASSTQVALAIHI